MSKSMVQMAAMACDLELVRSLRQGGGCPLVADDALNDATRQLITAVADEHGGAWLGRVNRRKVDDKPSGTAIVGRVTWPCGEREELSVVWQWDRAPVINFGADFVLPGTVADDALCDLVSLIVEKRDQTDTKANAVRFGAIIGRVKALGGYFLVWS